MKRLTKKCLVLALHAANRTVEEIARALECHPAYVANILEAEGKTPNMAQTCEVTQGGENGLSRFPGW